MEKEVQGTTMSLSTFMAEHNHNMERRTNNGYHQGSKAAMLLAATVNALNEANKALEFEEEEAGFDLNSYMPEQNKEKWDINGDGKLQKLEADMWWLIGGGETINVNNANIDWSGLEIPDGKVKGESFSINTTEAFLVLPYETASTYGGTSFEVISTQHVKVLDQLYHYDMRPENSMENIIRNYLTKEGKPIINGVNFMIHYYNPIILIK